MGHFEDLNVTSTRPAGSSVAFIESIGCLDRLDSGRHAVT